RARRAPTGARARSGRGEDIRQDRAVGLDEDREAAIPAGDREQVRGALALLPERGAGARRAPGQEERAGGVLAEARREQRGARDLADDDLLDVLRIGEQQLLGEADDLVAVVQPDSDPGVRAAQTR